MKRKDWKRMERMRGGYGGGWIISAALILGMAAIMALVILWVAGAL